MNCSVDLDPAVDTNFPVTVNTLNKATRTADNAFDWQLDIISVRKHTFNPVIIFKSGIAHRTPSFTLPGFDTLIQAEWAG